MIEENKTYHIYTDGGCQNYGTRPGGWAYAIVNEAEDTLIYESNGELLGTTSNRMELMAAIEGVDKVLYWCTKEDINPSDIKLIVHSDSQYLVNGITTWIKNWIKKDYEDVKNPDLWRKLHELTNLMGGVYFKWVKSHNGNRWNDYVDELCTYSHIEIGKEDAVLAVLKEETIDTPRGRLESLLGKRCVDDLEQFIRHLI